MKIDIKIQNQTQDEEVNPEEFGYPQGPKVLSTPADLEIQFFNAATIEDPENPGTYIDNPNWERLAGTPIEKTNELNRAVYQLRQQIDHYNYYKNNYQIAEQVIIDEFGPANPNRWKREPLKPIVVSDPNTDLPNIKDVDDGLRRDGIGVNTPTFHVELLKDKLPRSKDNYKEKNIVRGFNLDIKRALRVFPDDYKYTKKYTKGNKIKKGRKIADGGEHNVLTYVFSNIREPKAHLSIEEIESASHCVFTAPALVMKNGGLVMDDNNPEVGLYEVDSLEGIFWNKFDTFLSKDRNVVKEEGAPESVTARYKITKEPYYTATAYTKPILQFTAGGVLKVKAYMVPRTWLNYARFYSPDVDVANGENLIDVDYWFRVFYKGDTMYAVRVVALDTVRDPIETYTNLFCIWTTPPHNFRLPQRDDRILDHGYENMPFNPLLQQPTSKLRIPCSFFPSFMNWEYSTERAAEYGAYYDYVPLYSGLKPEGWDGVTWPEVQQWKPWLDVQHDYLTSDNLIQTGSKDVRNLANRCFGADVFSMDQQSRPIKNEYPYYKYGWFRGGMRGLFLYNFLGIYQSYVAPYWQNWFNYGLRTDYHYTTWHSTTEEIYPHMIHNAPLAPIWRKTPDGCVPQRYQKEWTNLRVGLPLKTNLENNRMFPRECLVAYNMVWTPPDGGPFQVDTAIEPITCGQCSPEPDVVETRYLYSDPAWPTYRFYPDVPHIPIDGKTTGGNFLYLEEDMVNFKRLWDKFYNFSSIQTRLADCNAGTNPADNVPFITAVAGARGERRNEAGEITESGTLVAVLKVGTRVFYVWRSIDEEKEDQCPIPLLSQSGGGGYDAPLIINVPGHEPVRYNKYFPLFGCGEVDNGRDVDEYDGEGHPTGNKLAELDSNTGHIEIAATTLKTDIEVNGCFGQVAGSTNYNTWLFPGLNRLMTKIIHWEVGWNASSHDDFWTNLPMWNPASYPPGATAGVEVISGPEPLGSPWVYDYARRETENPILTKTSVFDLEMPAYIMTYREVALHNDGPGATRWAGSWNYNDSTDSGFTVTADKRNRDTCV